MSIKNSMFYKLKNFTFSRIKFEMTFPKVHLNYAKDMQKNVFYLNIS